MEFVQSLGEGSYGHVDLVKFTDPDGSNPYYEAVKTSYAESRKYLRKEFKILSKLRECSRIVKTSGTRVWRGYNDKGERVYRMSMEYAAGGNLTSLMEEKVLTDSMIRDFTYMILEGLVSIHSHGYVHCDLKPDNILVFPRTCDGSNNISYELKISDFGMSTKTGKYSKFWDFDSPYLGTPLYMSPESVQNGIAEEALDLWSLGCIVLQMYTGESPWPEDQDLKELLHLLLNGKAPNIPMSLPLDVRVFINTCFASNRMERGSASELLKHKFLENCSEQKKVKVTDVGDERRFVVVIKREHIKNMPLKVKSKPFKPKRPLTLKIIGKYAPDPPEGDPPCLEVQ